MINEKRVDQLMAAITLYTTQLEDYDKSNFNACMTCIGFVGGLIAVVGAILTNSSVENQKNIFLNETISILLLLIPAIITLFLYNFAMNCRRSALFRGYVQFLENQLNKIMKSDDMLFSNFLIPEYYASFAVNHFGPIAMSIFLLFIFPISFGISIVFALKSSSDTFICWYRIGSILFIILCVILDGIYIYSLMGNNKVIEQTLYKCEQKYKKSRT